MEKIVVRRIFQIVAAMLVVALVIGLYRAKTEAGAADWLLRNTSEPTDTTPTALRGFYWFGSLLPRAPDWTRRE